MKKILLPTIFCLLFSIQNLFANDGAFYVSGNTLIPLQETQISLKKEVLKFYVRNYQWMHVEVNFEFFNPGKAKTITVGFVTPPASGDVTEEDEKHPRIKNFTVNVNGKILTYKIKKMNKTSFSSEKLQIDGDDFVYYFPVTFKTGLNKIRHTYQYFGGNGVELDRDFDYQITTGKRWANKQIDDFELQIYLDNGIFAIPARFIKPTVDVSLKPNAELADWKIVGDGVMEENARQWFGSELPQVRMVHLNRGYLLFKEKNFKPDYDVSLGEYNWAAGWADTWCNYGQECVEADSLEKVTRYFDLKPDWEVEAKDFAEFTAKEFKYLRNYFYAVRGIDFKDEQLRKFYEQFFGYKPDKTLKAENLKLSKAEEDFLKKLKTIELKQGK